MSRTTRRQRKNVDDFADSLRERRNNYHRERVSSAQITALYRQPCDDQIDFGDDSRAIKMG